MSEILTKEILFKHIIKACEDNFVFPKNDEKALEILICKDRRTEYVAIREKIVKLLKNEYGWSFPRIGRFLEKDHTSAMHLYYKNQK